MKQYYAVFDTNVLVSALLSRNAVSPTVALLDHILDQTIIPVYNEEILNEYNEVLHRSKFSFASEQINAVLAAIRSGISADRTPAKWNFPDEEDIVFYEVALSVDKAYLITGNTRHFPPVNKVVTPAEMMRIIKGNV
ncbi:MAG: putative toxin-antitoxin system toxin component, PIN family [Bacteroidales bacterium]|nr:putative toxin-antitoxin system toxin component, PIN family [Bacteroidales bacterium]MBR0539085.1 putative toxin-antitoxin system toxin component, PIN family [Bacteroidales bacterium]